MSLSNSYGFLDRILHYFAFGVPFVQKTLCDLENDLFKRELAAVESRHEVFITGLPRAGTTLMLELLYATGDFKTYTYRDMPFILSPLLWNKLSGSFRKAGEKRERAHGDGMEISFDSPEAFEEVVWLAYMADDIVRDHTLSTVSADRLKEESVSAIRNSVLKVLALAEHAGDDSQPLRYLSKNNANISRINALLELFPTSNILVIFRDPLAHTSSLARQHESFLREHDTDLFSQQYMKWIGHYDFGKNFKPINFGGWLDETELPSKIDETFWMKYWNAAYVYALEHKTDRVYFVDFDKLLQDRKVSLGRIAKSLALEHAEALIDAASTLRSPTTRPVEINNCTPDVWNRTQEIHAQLKSLAI